MKKFILAVLAVLLLIGLASCSPDPTPKTYTVKFVYGPNASDVIKVDVISGSQITEPRVPVRSDNKVVKHWYYDDNGQKKVTFPIKVTKDMTLNAVWEDDYYTVKFVNFLTTTDLNNVADTKAILSGTKITDAPLLNRGGYVFIGWTTTTTNYGKQTFDLDVAIDKDLTLYSVWVKSEGEIKFVFNSPDPVNLNLKDYSIDFVSSQAIGLPKAGNTFYTLTTWTDASKAYTAGTSNNFSSATSLTAQWTTNTVYVEFYDGDDLKKSESVKIKDTIDLATITSLVSAKEHFNLVGWENTSEYLSYSTDSDLTISNSLHFDNDNKLKLSTKWTPKKYVVNYFDGATLNTSSLVEYNNKAANVSAEKDNFVLAGWTTDSDWKDSGAAKFDFANNVITTDTNLYAMWKEAINIHYDFNLDGVDVKNLPIVTDVKSYEGNEIELPEIEAPFYVITTWTDLADPTSKTNYAAGSNQAFTTSTNLKAVWVPREITVKFYVDNGVTSTTNIKAGGSLSLSDFATTTDYHYLAGWKNKNATNDEYTSSANLSISTGLKLSEKGVLELEADLKEILYTFIYHYGTSNTNTYKQYWTITSGTDSDKVVLKTKAELDNFTHSTKTHFLGWSTTDTNLPSGQKISYVVKEGYKWNTSNFNNLYNPKGVTCVDLWAAWGNELTIKPGEHPSTTFKNATNKYYGMDENELKDYKDKDDTDEIGYNTPVSSIYPDSEGKLAENGWFWTIWNVGGTEVGSLTMTTTTDSEITAIYKACDEWFEFFPTSGSDFKIKIENASPQTFDTIWSGKSLPSKDGYKFLGWKENTSNSDTADYTTASELKWKESKSDSEAVPVYNIFSPKTYKIVYMKDDGSTTIETDSAATNKFEKAKAVNTSYTDSQVCSDESTYEFSDSWFVVDSTGALKDGYHIINADFNLKDAPYNWFTDNGDDMTIYLRAVTNPKT